jgi:hypothetical protein
MTTLIIDQRLALDGIDCVAAKQVLFRQRVVGK